MAEIRVETREILAVGPLHMLQSSLTASDQAFGLIYGAATPRGLRGLQRARKIRGFYYPLQDRLIWVYLDYR